MTELTVWHWPDGGIRLDPSQPLLIVAVDMPETSIRDRARQQVRAILRQILAPYLGCSPPDVSLISLSGQAPYVANHPHIGLSISHEPGLSLLAINLAGPVGVDLMTRPAIANWQGEISTLARDYLGIQMHGDSPAQRQQNFAAAWTAHEAKLKCLGWGLTEWTTALQEQLAECLAYPLTTGRGFSAALAIRKPR